MAGFISGAGGGSLACEVVSVFFRKFRGVYVNGRSCEGRDRGLSFGGAIDCSDGTGAAALIEGVAVSISRGAANRDEPCDVFQVASDCVVDGRLVDRDMKEVLHVVEVCVDVEVDGREDETFSGSIRMFPV